MPARSNEFQRLVRVVRDHLADESATVVESAMLVDAITGERREVDVCITREVAGLMVVVAIECRDHSRRAGTPWVEEMYAKHQHLPTDHLVLASRGGFTSPARRKAAVLHLELIELNDATVADDVERIIVGTDGVVWTKIGSVMPQSIFVAVENESFGQEIEVAANIALYSIHDGRHTQVAPMAVVVEALVAERRSEMHMSTPFSELDVVSNVEFVCDATEEFDEPVLIRIGPRGDYYEIKRIRVLAEATHRSRPVPLRHGELGGIPTAFGRWVPNEDPKMMIVTETDRPRITIVDDPGP